jgi:hypothetical protein
MQESEKVMLLKGDTDKHHLLMVNTTNLISTVERNKFDSVKKITGSHTALFNGIRFGFPDTAGGYVVVSYYFVTKGTIFSNIAKNFITIFDG